MPHELFDLTGFQRDLLYVIAGQHQPSGQRIVEELERDFSEITHGRLYPNLDTLVLNELITKGERDRRTNYYELTDSCDTALQNRRDWENQLVDFSTTTHGAEVELNAGDSAN